MPIGIHHYLANIRLSDGKRMRMRFNDARVLVRQLELEGASEALDRSPQCS